MNFAILVFFSAVVCTLGDDGCPDPKDIAPCTCDGEGVNCMLAKSLEEVKRAFSANFKYGGVRAVWLQATRITSLPKDAFGNKVRSQQFYVEVNNISQVDLDAFSVSKEILDTLSLYGNQVQQLDFSRFGQYQRLAVLNLAKNKISVIPQNAFPTMANMQRLLLVQNQIESIGSNAFAGLVNLQALDLTGNALKTLGPSSLSFKSHSVSLQISVAMNQISNVSDTAFLGTEPYYVSLSANKLTKLPYSAFGNLITAIARKAGYLELYANPFTCNGCDYSWMVLNKDLLQGRLVGFTCSDGRSLDQLSKGNINCNQ